MASPGKRARSSKSHTWTDEQKLVFLRILANWKISHGPKQAYKWNEILEEFIKQTGVQVTKDVLHNKLSTMRSDYGHWKNLLKGETGLGIDPTTGFIQADALWWERKIKENKEYKKFRTSGIPKDVEDLYAQVFDGSMATGEHLVMPGQFEYIWSMDRQPNRDWFMSMGGNVAATVCAAAIAYLEGFIPRESSSSPDAGLQWMQSILDGPEDICMNFFRMEAHVVLSLCEDLKNTYGLRDTNISALEKVGIFLFVIASHRTNRDAQAIFRHSGWTISSVFHEVLECIVGRSRNFSGLVNDLVCPLDRTFPVSTTLMNDRRYYPYFQNCIGAIDGTHISACVPETESGKYRNRKGWCYFNVMATCDFDLHFTSVAVGYEGSAHDSKVLNEVLNNHRHLFPVAPEGKFYVADKGYADRLGFLTPYPDGRYHLTEFECEAPRNVHELFNKRHSSLRSCIECSFGCLKQKWRILHEMPPFSLETQIDIIMACFALHNYVRLHKRNDAHFNHAIRFPRQMLAEVLQREQRQPNDEQVPPEDTAPMGQRVVMAGIRNHIAASIAAGVVNHY